MCWKRKKYSRNEEVSKYLKDLDNVEKINNVVNESAFYYYFWVSKSSWETSLPGKGDTKASLSLQLRLYNYIIADKRFFDEEQK